MNITIAAALVSLSLVFSAQAQTDSLSVEQTIREALAQNARVQSAAQMEQSLRSKARSVGAWSDPMLMLGVNNLPTSWSLNEDPMTMTMIGISQTIPLAGQQGLKTKAAEKEADAAHAMMRQTKSDVIASVRQAFSELYFRQLILIDTRRQRDILADIAQATSDRFRIGLVGQEDVTTAQASLLRFDTQVRSAEQDVLASWHQLCAIWGTTVSDSVPSLRMPVEDELPVQVAVWDSAALHHYGELARIRSQSESYGFSAAASRRMRWPMLTLSSSIGFRRDGVPTAMDSGIRGNMMSFQAAFSIPIFAGRREGQMAQSMDAMSRSNSADAVQMERDVIAQIHSLYSRAASLRQSIRTYHEGVIPATDQAYEAAMSSYQTNRMTLGNLLSFAMQRLADRTAMNQLSLDLAATMAEVSRYITDPSTVAPPTP